jgi:luciferase family oxidoreductase group 1
MRLSVLDLVPVRTDQSTADAVAATVRLAQTADRLGYTRYWLAEHHNMPSVGATSPPVLIAYLAAQTAQLRLGSGGIMLPNHAPLACWKPPRRAASTWGSAGRPVRTR